MTLTDQPSLLKLINTIINTLEAENIPYCLLGSASLFLQGVKCPVDAIDISIQWDAFEKVAEAYQANVEKHDRRASFETIIQQVKVFFQCEYNTVVVTDPDRLAVKTNDQVYWVKAWDFYLRSLKDGDPLRELIKRHLLDLQRESTEAAGDAWSDGAYEAWVNRFGPPEKWGARINRDPDTRLATLKPYIEHLDGKKVINLLGSHGTKAIAMGLCGASVTVVDISPENARYAKEVAETVGVSLHYIVSDVLNLPKEEISGDYDLVFMELGILHYFIDLEPLVKIIKGLLGPGGRAIVQDFHPVSTKLLSSKGNKHKVTGNYFDKTLIETNVAFSKYGSESAPKKVYERKWTLGEIVTAFAEGGLMIKKLDEQPNIKMSDIGIPKTFTLIAEKIKSF
jgi:SAM-dependent methyltransferase